jgi:hypothetical protein
MVVNKSSFLKKFITTLSIFGIFLSINFSNSPKAEALSPVEFPYVQLVVNTKAWNGTAWENSSVTPPATGGWGFWRCDDTDFYGLKMRGIADYEDGISRRAYAKALEEMEKGKNLDGSYSGFIPVDADTLVDNERSCNEYNVKAYNLVPGCGNVFFAPNNPDQYQVFAHEVGCGNYGNFQPANNPVYAYQFRYNYDFPFNLREQLSEQYRDLTGLAGSYEGVSWTYTYYTYFDSQTNSYIPWENPNRDNINGGFLIYGLNRECPSGYIYHDGECYDDNNYDMAQPDKPVIYAYPQEEADINIKVDYQGEFKFTYPEYNRDTGWNVRVKPNGDMVASDGNEYPYLFWEGKDYPIAVNKNEGFVVKQEDVVEFLEEKLDYMGLNSREKTDFITYWGPRMLGSNYYYINFPNEQFDQMAPLRVSPQPDSTQRIFMVYEGLDKAITVEEQKLEKFERSGYSLIEWGGSELN